MSNQSETHAPPPIPLELIRWIDRVFPERPVTAASTPHDLAFNAGQRDVVARLTAAAGVVIEKEYRHVHRQRTEHSGGPAASRGSSTRPA